MKSPANKDSVIARYIEGPKLLERALAGLTEADLDTAPAKGGWSIRQIVHHLADGDDLWKMGIVSYDWKWFNLFTLWSLCGLEIKNGK